MKKYGVTMSKSLILVLTIAILLGSGCGISLPPFSFSTVVLNDVELGPILNLPVGIPVNGEFSLGELCDIPTLDDLIARAEAELGFSIPILITLDAVNIDEFVLESTQGDFDFVTSIELLIESEGVTLSLGTATPDSADATVLRFTPNGELNLLDILPEQGCAVAKIRLVGTTPTETVIFNGTLSVTVQLSI